MGSARSSPIIKTFRALVERPSGHNLLFAAAPPGLAGVSPNGGYYDYLTIKYSNSGVPLWTNLYNGPGDYEDFAWALAVDSSGNVFVTGISFLQSTGRAEAGRLRDDCVLK